MPPPRQCGRILAEKGGEIVKDVQKLRNAIQTFMSESQPHSWSTSSPATIGDINKLRESIGRLMKKFVDELECP